MTKVGGRISIVLRKQLIIKQLLITNNPIVYSRHIKLKEKKSLKKKLKNVYFCKKTRGKNIAAVYFGK